MFMQKIEFKFEFPIIYHEFDETLTYLQKPTGGVSVLPPVFNKDKDSKNKENKDAHTPEQNGTDIDQLNPSEENEKSPKDKRAKVCS